MKRFLIIPEMVVEDEAHDISVLINLDAIPIWHWCLELCLLQNNLTESLNISSNETDVKLRLLNASEISTGRRSTVIWKDNLALIELTSTEIEYWLAWSLKYYRDGIADVNHIDVEIKSQSKTKNIALTLMVNNAQPPVSAEEARRRLGV